MEHVFLSSGVILSVPAVNFQGCYAYILALSTLGDFGISFRDHAVETQKPPVFFRAEIVWPEKKTLKKQLNDLGQCFNNVCMNFPPLVIVLIQGFLETQKRILTTRKRNTIFFPKLPRITQNQYPQKPVSFVWTMEKIKHKRPTKHPNMLSQPNFLFSIGSGWYEQIQLNNHPPKLYAGKKTSGHFGVFASLYKKNQGPNFSRKKNTPY